MKSKRSQNWTPKVKVNYSPIWMFMNLSLPHALLTLCSYLHHHHYFSSTQLQLPHIFFFRGLFWLFTILQTYNRALCKQNKNRKEKWNFCSIYSLEQRIDFMESVNLEWAREGEKKRKEEINKQYKIY